MDLRFRNPGNYRCLFCGAMALISLVGIARGQSYSVAGNYSSTSNPNGVWTYGWLNSLGGTLTDFTENDLSSSSGGTITEWHDPNNEIAAVPTVGANEGSTDWSGGGFTVPAGWAFFAPGFAQESGDLGDIRFTAPTGGTYHFNFLFEENQAGGSTDVYIYTSGSDYFSTSFTTQGSEQTYNGAIPLAAGQTLDIAVAAVGGGADDNVNLEGTISPVPEPSMGMPVAAGAGFLFVFAATRRRQTIDRSPSDRAGLS